MDISKQIYEDIKLKIFSYIKESNEPINFRKAQIAKRVQDLMSSGKTNEVRQTADGKSVIGNPEVANELNRLKAEIQELNNKNNNDNNNDNKPTSEGLLDVFKKKKEIKLTPKQIAFRKKLIKLNTPKKKEQPEIDLTVPKITTKGIFGESFDLAEAILLLENVVDKYLKDKGNKLQQEMKIKNKQLKHYEKDLGNADNIKKFTDTMKEYKSLAKQVANLHDKYQAHKENYKKATEKPAIKTIVGGKAYNVHGDEVKRKSKIGAYSSLTEAIINEVSKELAQNVFRKRMIKKDKAKDTYNNTGNTKDFDKYMKANAKFVKHCDLINKWDILKGLKRGKDGKFHDKTDYKEYKEKYE